MIDLDDNRLEVAKRFGATADGQQHRTATAAEQVMKLTGGRGVDTAIEAVGIPATFELCEDIVAAGRHHRQHRRARQQGRPPPGAPVVAQHHDHHPAGRHRHDADAAEDRAVETDRPEAR